MKFLRYIQILKLQISASEGQHIIWKCYIRVWLMVDYALSVHDRQSSSCGICSMCEWYVNLAIDVITLSGSANILFEVTAWKYVAMPNITVFIHLRAMCATVETNLLIYSIISIMFMFVGTFQFLIVSWQFPDNNIETSCKYISIFQSSHCVHKFKWA